MPDIKTIVFPVDFSDRSRGAARYVEALASKFPVPIKMVHVIPPVHYEGMSLEVSGPMMADVIASQESNARRILADFASTELKSFPLERVFLNGDPATKIVEYAAGQPGSLIVLPTHGYGPFRRFILGSVAAKVLHDAAGPVLTGTHMEKATAGPLINVKKVLAAVDLEGGTQKILEWAAGVAKIFGARLLVTHVAPSIEGRSGEVFDPNWREYFSKAPETAIKDALGKAGAEGDAIVTFGDPAKQVAELAAAENADLVVIGRSHDTSFQGRLRTHAYAIIRMAPCPVLSV